MSITLIFVAVVVVAFVGGRLISLHAARFQALSGIEYLLLGAAIGPYGLGVMSTDVLHALDPFVSFMLGLMGFLVGLGLLQVRGGLEVALAGATNALLLIAFVGGLAAAAMQVLDPQLLAVTDPLVSLPLLSDGRRLVSLWLAPQALWVGLTVGAAAAVSSVALVELAGRRHGVSEGRLTLLKSLGASGQATAVLVFGLAMAGTRATDSADALGLTLVEWGMITMAAGAACGVLFTLFVGREDDPMRMLVAAIGAITFSAGIGVALGVSPLFVNLIAGAIVGMSSPHAPRLDGALAALRHPARVLVLLLAGAYWTPVAGWAWMLPLGYALVRVLALRVVAPISAWTFLHETSPAIRLGAGLSGQAALAAAFAMNFAQRFPDAADVVTTSVLGGMILTNLFAARMLRRYLADQGAIHHQQVEGSTGEHLEHGTPDPSSSRDRRDVR